MKSQILIHGALLNEEQSRALRICVNDELDASNDCPSPYYQALKEINELLSQED